MVASTWFFNSIFTYKILVMKIAIIIWLAASLFVDSVPASPKGSKWGARFETFWLRLIAPVGLIRTAIVRIKAMRNGKG